MFEKWFPNVDLDVIWSATGETVYMTLISLAFAFAIGIILGLLLFLTSKGGLWENKPINTVIGAVVNIFRSIPFIILIILLLGFTKLIMGTIYTKCSTPCPCHRVSSILCTSCRNCTA